MTDEQFYFLVMERIDNFVDVLGDGDDSAEAVFRAWAPKYAAQFAEGCNAQENENKLE